jgi:hypothetical protein
MASLELSIKQSTLNRLSVKLKPCYISIHLKKFVLHVAWKEQKQAVVLTTLRRSLQKDFKLTTSNLNLSLTYTKVSEKLEKLTGLVTPFKSGMQLARPCYPKSASSSGQLVLESRP